MLVKERNLRKLLLLVGILMMAVAFAGCQQTPLQVTIPDSALEVALRNALNKPEGPIYNPDLESLTSLNLAEKNISDISALSGLTNLETLGLSGNNVSDISALSGLTNLETLRLWGNNISDISALVSNVGISSGDTVYLEYNPLSPEAINIHIPQLEERGASVTR